MENPKASEPLFLLTKDRSFGQTIGCVLYDNRLILPTSLEQLVFDSLHQTHPGQTRMLRLADLVLFPRIHRYVTTKARSCGDCIKKGKIPKPILPKQSLGKLPKLTEPNEEVQLVFAGPIPLREHNQNYYTLFSLDRLTCFPHAKVYKDCDTQTALNFLKVFCHSYQNPSAATKRNLSKLENLNFLFRISN